MSFADRLKKRPPMVIAAVKPQKSMNVQLCLPRVLEQDGRAVGLTNLTISPLLVGGVESTRLLTALEALLDAASDGRLSSQEATAELTEAHIAIRRHLDSLSAATALAREEHDASHQRERGLH